LVPEAYIKKLLNTTYKIGHEVGRSRHILDCALLERVSQQVVLAPLSLRSSPCESDS
jgi:hypothetical protein